MQGKLISLGAEEMVQWLRALDGFPENLSSVSSTYVMAFHHL